MTELDVAEGLHKKRRGGSEARRIGADAVTELDCPEREVAFHSVVLTVSPTLASLSHCKIFIQIIISQELNTFAEDGKRKLDERTWTLKAAQDQQRAIFEVVYYFSIPSELV